MFNFLHRRPALDPLNHPAWPAIGKHMPLLYGLNDTEWTALEARMRYFLATKHLEGVDDLELTDEDRLIIAAQACLPILNLDDTAYGDWSEFIVYPSAFVSRSTWRDEAGLVHEGSRALSGMARSDGPLLVSLPDTRMGPMLDGRNVVIHECAHKLDMLNGRANGSPPLHAGMNQAAWSRAFLDGYDRFREHLAYGHPPPIDPYAAESPAEFFAVLSEYFFELPHQLARLLPEIYTQLVQFYRQDPTKRLPDWTPHH
ncbi:MAG: zinc-dependent peptidase [Burkholderiales bacterium]|nr:zinc-dependent peptidase [Burkholderiales bacterium]